MRAYRSILALSLALSAAPAAAQDRLDADLEEEGDADEGDAKKSDAESDAADDGAAGKDAQAESRARTTKKPPALPDLSASKQYPPPYVPPPARDARLDFLDVGPDIGINYRSSESHRIDYSAGLTFGGHARIELFRHLGVRARLFRSVHPVNLPHGALLPGTGADQPDVEVLELGIRLEPTLPVTRELRLWAGLGIAWNRLWADEPTFTDRPVLAADRTGAALEYSLALGGTFDVIPNWLAVSLAGSAGIMAHQSGNMFERLQAVDEAASGDQALVYVSALPKFEHAYSAVLSVGLLL